MRPVDPKYPISQAFASMPTAGVVGNVNASPDTAEYWVGLYGNYQPDGHAGCDIACPVGTPVHAVKGGTVIYAGWDVNLPGGPNDWYARWFFYQRFGGRLVLVQRPSGVIDVVAHLSKISVNVGDVVREGRLLGLSGASAGGNDSALSPHLHVEKIINTGYPTGGGLIYGRTDPSPDFTGFAPVTAQSTPTKPKDWFDMASKEDLRAVLREENPWAYRNPKLEKDDAYALLRAARTYAVKAAADAAAAREIATQAAKKQGVTIDYGKIEAAVKSAIASGVEVGGTLTVKKAV